MLIEGFKLITQLRHFTEFKRSVERHIMHETLNDTKLGANTLAVFITPLSIEFSIGNLP